MAMSFPIMGRKRERKTNFVDKLSHVSFTIITILTDQAFCMLLCKVKVIIPKLSKYETYKSMSESRS